MPAVEKKEWSILAEMVEVAEAIELLSRLKKISDTDSQYVLGKKQIDLLLKIIKTYAQSYEESMSEKKDLVWLNDMAGKVISELFDVTESDEKQAERAGKILLKYNRVMSKKLKELKNDRAKVES